MRFYLVIASLLLLSGCGVIGTTVAAIGKGVQVGNQSRTAGTAVDDITMETTINHRFFRADLNDLFKNVDVDVIEGRVFLTGNVNLHATMLRAVDIAWEVRNVREVINEIQVENTSNVVDAAQDIWIELQIEGELLVTKGIISPNYNVECVNGIVTLMGIAQNDVELRKVADITSRTAGVKQVVSHVIMQDDPRRVIPKAPKPMNSMNGNVESNPPYSPSNEEQYLRHDIPDDPANSFDIRTDNLSEDSDSSDYYNDLNYK